VCAESPRPVVHREGDLGRVGRGKGGNGGVSVPVAWEGPASAWLCRLIASSGVGAKGPSGGVSGGGKGARPKMDGGKGDHGAGAEEGAGVKGEADSSPCARIDGGCAGGRLDAVSRIASCSALLGSPAMMESRRHDFSFHVLR